MIRFKNIILPLACSLVVLLGSEYYFSEYMIESRHQVVLQGFFPVDCELSVFFENDTGKRVNIENLKITGKAPHVDQRFFINLHGKVITDLGLEFTTTSRLLEDNSIYIHFIDILNSFTEDIRYSHEDLQDCFVSKQFSKKEINRFDFDPKSGKITLLSRRGNLSNPPNPLFSITFSILLSLMTFIIVLYSNIRKLPAFQDMKERKGITNNADFHIINGMRGFSALLVLLSHTAPRFTFLGMGLALLFVLSGFLLAKPFVLETKNIFQTETILVYLVKRLKRILPMYYFTVFMFYFVSFEFDIAVRHFLLVEARGHLWAIPQILAFYILLPAILILTSFAYRLNRLLPVIILIIMIILWNEYHFFPQLFYNGLYHTPFMLDGFLLGVAASYLQYGFIGTSKRLQKFIESNVLVLSSFAIFITTFVIAWSAPITPPALISDLITRFDVKCVFAVLIILFAVNTPDSTFAKIIGNKMFRSLGVIGFSFYLLHGWGIQLVWKFQETVLGHAEIVEQSWILTISVFIITYTTSLFTYSFIERPFFAKDKSIS